MEEIKFVLELMSGATVAALWVLVILYLYKVIIVGSIYGVIRFVVSKIYAWKVHGKYSLREKTLDDSTAQVLYAEISRISKSAYIRMQDVDKLRKILDDNL